MLHSNFFFSCNTFLKNKKVSQSHSYHESSCNLNLYGCLLSTRGSVLPAEQITQLQEKAQKEVLVVRQRLDEALTQEKRAMRCELIKKRRELISDTVRRPRTLEPLCSCQGTHGTPILHMQTY